MKLRPFRHGDCIPVGSIEQFNAVVDMLQASGINFVSENRALSYLSALGNPCLSIDISKDTVSGRLTFHRGFTKPIPRDVIEVEFETKVIAKQPQCATICFMGITYEREEFLKAISELEKL